MPANEKGKGVTEERYETGSDVDACDLQMMEERFTQLEISLELSTRTIAIPMDLDLLKNTEKVVPSFSPLCSEIEGKNLKELDDATRLRSIAGLTLRVNIWCCVLFLSLFLFLTYFFSFPVVDDDFRDRERSEGGKA